MSMLNATEEMQSLHALLASDGPLDAAKRLEGLAWRYAHSHSPAEALRFLFELDAKLYSLQGMMSIAYDGGVHTKHRHIRYHDFFVERIRAGQTVLDIGCGHGAVAWDVAVRTEALVTGIDLNGKNIAKAAVMHQHPNVTYITGDARTDLPAGHYDVVILSNVLEHIDDRVTFLRQIASAATPERWLIRVPLFERDWRVPLKKELGIEWRLDPTHYIEYTQETFEQEVTAAGLQIVEQQTRWGEIWCELREAHA